MERRTITAAGIYSVNGERYLVLEYDDGEREAYSAAWFDRRDWSAINSDDEATCRAWLAEIMRDGVDDWTIDSDPIFADRLLDGYEGLAICGVGVGY